MSSAQHRIARAHELLLRSSERPTVAARGRGVLLCSANHMSPSNVSAIRATRLCTFYVRFRGDNVLELLQSTGSAATIVYTTMGYRYTTLQYERFEQFQLRVAARHIHMSHHNRSFLCCAALRPRRAAPTPAQTLRVLSGARANLSFRDCTLRLRRGIRMSAHKRRCALSDRSGMKTTAEQNRTEERTKQNTTLGAINSIGDSTRHDSYG